MKEDRIKMENEFDFCGWASKNNLRCSDGRIIRKDAFKHNDGETVPLVWNHDHTDPYRIVGHARLENRDEGVYAFCKFNDTDLGKTARIYVEHGDITQMSIYANQLQQQGDNVIHGSIREVSLVLAGANPGAYIESVVKHSDDDSDEEAIIYTGEDITLTHADEKDSEEETTTQAEEEEVIVHAEESSKNETTTEEAKPEGEKTIAEIFNTLNEEQKEVVYAMLGEALNEGAKNNNDKGDDNMKHNVFDQTTETNENVLSHDAMNTIIADAKRYGSLKESFLAHAQEYGIESIDYLFPEVKTLNTPPEFIKRDTGWVSDVMNSVHKTPFSRIKSTLADITEDEARAKGYIKGNLKKEEVFSLLKRSTTPTTVYKKQKLDRDDVVDITDFDVISWLKHEMRMMLDEEIARAILIGDGRLASSDDKINEQNIRPVVSDSELFTIKTLVNVAKGATDDDKAKATIKAAVKARKNYKGSGNPTLYTTEDFLTNALLLEDTQGHRLYKNESDVAAAMRVSKIVTVPVMEGVKGPNSKDLIGIIVNLEDYNVGADKGGAINMFDDFDIDYNQQKYLIETRCSGALIKPYSAVVLELNEAEA
jgi:HK97 family phage prohead protease